MFFSLFLTFLFLKRNFKGRYFFTLFNFQDAVSFCLSLICDSLFIIPLLLDLVKYFFQISLKFFAVFFRLAFATAFLLYHFLSILSSTFFEFFSKFFSVIFLSSLCDSSSIISLSLALVKYFVQLFLKKVLRDTFYHRSLLLTPSRATPVGLPFLCLVLATFIFYHTLYLLSTPFRHNLIPCFSVILCAFCYSSFCIGFYRQFFTLFFLFSIENYFIL